MAFFTVAFIFSGGAAGSIHIDTSSFHIPLSRAIILCSSPGVMYAIHALFIAAVSIGAEATEDVSFFSTEEESAFAMLSFLVLLSLQLNSARDAAKIVRVKGF